MNKTAVLKQIIAVFFSLNCPLQAHALSPDQVFEKVKDSIVVVKSLDINGKMKGQGSGVLLSSGQIATNCHVVEGGTSYTVVQGAQVTSATLSAGDRDKDICLLDAKKFRGKPVQIGTTKSLKVGVKVFAVGAPRGLELSLSDGIIAQLRGGPPPMIQTTAAISSGSSGGGLFDDEGRLIGLTTLYMKGGQNLNFAMPVEWIRDVTSSRKQAASGQHQADWQKCSLVFKKSKDWNGLLEWCGKWIKSEPNNALAWWSLGSAYFGLERYTEAVNALRQALRIDPQIAETWSNLGAVYIRLNRYSDAVDAYRQTLRIDPNSTETWGKLGAAYSRLNRYPDAVDACRQGLRIDPKHVSTWALLGNSYTRLKRYNDAVGAYRQALRIDPNFANAWAGLVVTYNESGDQQAALSTIEELRRLDPQWAAELNNVIAPRN